MDPLTRIDGPAAPLLVANINTDVIAPAPRRGTGSDPRTAAERGAALFFAPWRFDAEGREIPDFVLNRPPFREAKFLIAGDNFACGSSRESAVLYLKAWGLRAVIAPGFGQIFYDNCFRNGVLPLVVDQPTVEALAAEAADGAPFAADVAAGTLIAPSGRRLAFTLPAFRQELLLSGTDEVTLTLREADRITSWQEAARRARPWAYPETRAARPVIAGEPTRRDR
jgi:3-isopropylmalate/(R)-2-methylmalate dehydratase small subunit